MTHPSIDYLDPDEAPPQSHLMPVYSLTEGLYQVQMRRIAASVIEHFVDALEEVIPEQYRKEHDLLSIQEAVAMIHAASDEEVLARARRRFIYQEFLVLQLALALKRYEQGEAATAIPLPISEKIRARVENRFPFALTDSQKHALEEIYVDMGNPHPMNRLLQGDVGSGKTVVAVGAMLLAVAHGSQAAMMAPTEVLARQHYNTLTDMLSESQVRVGLLTGSLSTAERRDVMEGISSGEINILVGTQAVVQSGVNFAQLGLAVIDEQHKFGVRQRASLRQGDADPHYLVMTATPIPRTVAMTAFGDLDLSVMREKPPGRSEVHTYVAGADKRQRWWAFFKKKLDEGQQGYVITPLVEDSENIDAASLNTAFEQLANDELADYRLDLIHGRLSAEDKEAVMQAFRQGDIQVLVATSVVEVGVDIANANIMTIENGERFGLAQLHQLRGRVGRGAHPGFVCVFHGTDDEKALERLEAFAATSDGFQLAETDLQLRGTGDLFGTRQHGLPAFRAADPLRDAEILSEARQDALQLLAEDPGLKQEEFARLRHMAMVRYGGSLNLGDVG